MKLVEVAYFSDLLCVWAYIAEARIEQLAQGSPLRQYPVERLRLLNDLYPNKEPTPGELVKVVD